MKRTAGTPGSGRNEDADRRAAEIEAGARIDAAVGRARLVLVWEAAWPKLAPILTIVALFVAVSWFGLWRVTATPLRAGILAGFAAALVYFLARLARVATPGRDAALARIEKASGLSHRPATAFGDTLASGRADPVAEALWTAHRRRLLAALDRLKAGTPSPGLAGRDPYALRQLAILLLAVGFVFAGPERLERVREAFRGGETIAAAAARIDAWVTPPAYTGRAPIFLTGEAAKPAGTTYTVPAGSVVTVRIGGASDLAVEGEGQAATAKPGSAGADGTAPAERQVVLSKATVVTVKKGATEVAAWHFAVEPDSAPRIAFRRPPGETASGALDLAYSLKDDYGIVSAEAVIASVAPAPADVAARPLYEAPALALTLPQLRVRDGSGETIRDLTAHPWAGAKVTVTLVARDDAGQEGRSEPFEMTLPKRRFTDPIARAVVEQRAKLAADANQAGAVADALDAITLVPERTTPAFGTYLALRSAYDRLVRARDDDGLRDVADYLWTIALGLEDGDLSLAALQLRDAQEALRQALERGASDEEIKTLTEALREALQKFTQALTEQALRNPNLALQPPDPNAQMLRQEDLERMLDRIETLARTGARDAAQQLLSELQSMLESLQTAQPQEGDPQSAEQMMESLNQLGAMIKRQQALMDKTFRAERGLDPESGNPMPLTNEQLDEALRQLQAEQGELSEALKDLTGKLGEMGMGENGKLGQAGEAMGKAGDALGRGEAGTAVESQGQALDALRQGADGLARQMASRGRGGGFRTGSGPQNEDPLGRPQRTNGPDLGTSVKVPDEIDTQRAREILDQIRKRLGETARPEMELQYLERLLDKF